MKDFHFAIIFQKFPVLEILNCFFSANITGYKHRLVISVFISTLSFWWLARQRQAWNANDCATKIHRLLYISRTSPDYSKTFVMLGALNTYSVSYSASTFYRSTSIKLAELTFIHFHAYCIKWRVYSFTITTKRK